MTDRSRTPLYIQVREYLMDQISNNTWKPHDKIPSENELSRLFSVSRITVSNAISHLVNEGIVYRIKGKGTFISSSKTGEPKIYESPQNNLVAFLMPRLNNMFTAKILSGIEDEISKNGFQLIFFKTDDSQEKETRIIKELLDINVKGMIIFPTADEDYNEETLKLTLNNFPLVVVDRHLRGVETNCVYSDNIKGAFDATSHLIELGHRKIGIISPSKKRTTSLEDRLIGYEKALTHHLIPIESRLQLFSLDMEKINSIYQKGAPDKDSKERIKEYLTENPDITAIFVVNPAIGLTVMEAAKELNITIPNDLSIIFFDDYELSTMSNTPPTCVVQQEFELGIQAAKLLLSLIKEQKQERRKIVLPTKLIVRNTTGKPREV